MVDQPDFSGTTDIVSMPLRCVTVTILPAIFCVWTVNDMSIETRASLLMRLRAADDALAWSDFVCIYEPVIYRIA